MRTFPDHIAEVREEERGFAASVHLLNLIPFWGIFFAVGVWLYFKERSRPVVFHAQQAILFQSVFLAASFVWLLGEMLLKIVMVLNPDLALFLSKSNFILLIVCYGFYALLCVIGTFGTLMGRSFLYPLIGRRVLEGALSKPVARD
ncbi:MAG: DUF4870 domain-containing protein [Sumerlaeia bacterium]